MIHRDLKLENILVFDKFQKLSYKTGDESTFYHVKLADFGLANKIEHEDELLRTFCGSLLYAAPEVVHGKPYNGPKVDAWALGVVLYALVYGAMPFEHTVQNVLLSQISKGEFYRHKKRHLAENLIERLLCVDPIERGSITEAMDSEWMNLQSDDSYFSFNLTKDESANFYYEKPVKKSSISSPSSESSSYLPSTDSALKHSSENIENSSTNPFINIEDAEQHQEEFHISTRNLSKEEALLIKRLDHSYGFGNLKLTDDDDGEDNNSSFQAHEDFKELLTPKFSSSSTPKRKTDTQEKKSQRSVENLIKTSDFSSSGSEVHVEASFLSLDSSDSDNNDKNNNSGIETFERLDQLTAMMSNINKNVDSFLERATELQRNLDAICK